MSGKAIFFLAVFVLAVTAAIPGNSDALFVATAQKPARRPVTKGLDRHQATLRRWP